jgi:hypothetical protein
MTQEYQNYRGQILGENSLGETKRIKTDDNGVLQTKSIGNILVEQLTEANAVFSYEVANLIVTAASTVASNVTVTLNGIATTVAVLSTDTAIQVADKIRATVFTGWTTGGTVGTTTVTFTATTSGNKVDATYSEGTTGATGTMTTAAQGTNPVLTFLNNIFIVQIYNTSVTTGTFNVNGIDITVPADKVFDATIGGTPSVNVLVTGATTYIISRYE